MDRPSKPTGAKASVDPPSKPTGAIGVFDRFATWVQVMFVACDQWLACWIRGFVFVWLGGEKPSADETLSAWVGRCAIAGYRAGRIAEKVIDFVMTQPGHCRRAIARDDLD